MKVSICSITYNHEQFIVEALNSFLQQKTAFDKEVVISDDYSADKTVLLIQEFMAAHPGLIRLNANTVNKGMKKNFFEAIRMCRGEYIAFCEGDDYWSDTAKLQKQVTFLDANPEVVMCFSDVVKVDEEGRPMDDVVNDYPYTILPDQTVIKGFWTPTLSVCVRKSNLLDVINKIDDGQFVLNLDWVVFSLLEEQGKIAYVKTLPSCYRQHAGGVFSARTTKAKLIQSLNTVRYLRPLIKHENQRSLDVAELSWNNVYLYSLIGNNKYMSFIFHELKLLLSLLFNIKLKLTYKAIKDFFVIIRTSTNYKRSKGLSLTKRILDS